jgi:poly-gamma-glutamate synthesis protein (capsule biosynthesis protein)
MAGLATSLSAIRGAGLEPLGAYATNEEFRASKGYTIREVNGVKVAFVAFTKGMNGMALPAGNEHCVNVLYTDYATTYQDVDSEKILSILNAAKKESPDVIVALLHWGSEYNDTISKSQETILELLQDNGVAVILGTHSHYLQKMMFDAAEGTF